MRIMPQTRKIPAPRPECESVALHPDNAGRPGDGALVLLGRLQGAQLIVPIGLQGIGHQAMVGIDPQIAPPGQLGLVTRPLHLVVAQRIGFIPASLKLLLDCQGYFQT
ncbi:MAG: hypothetical protein MZV64_71590 [Ignavibacteriales bacterium]|nr:hypothetical protein [Ignavibacteriales bacterium]